MTPLKLPPLPYSLDDPLEQGGLIFGAPGEVRMVTGTATGDERGERHWMPTDAAHVRAAELAQSLGYRQLGWWHSHPAGTPQTPSEVDAEQFRMALEHLGAEQLWFPIVTGGIVRVFTITHTEGIEEVEWTSQP